MVYCLQQIEVFITIDLYICILLTTMFILPKLEFNKEPEFGSKFNH